MDRFSDRSSTLLASTSGVAPAGSPYPAPCFAGGLAFVQGLNECLGTWAAYVFAGALADEFLRPAEHVADATDGGQAVGVLPQLVAQALDVAVHRADIPGVVHLPHRR